MKSDYVNIRKWEKAWKGLLPQLQEEQRQLYALEEYARDTSVLFLNWCSDNGWSKTANHGIVYYTTGDRWLLPYELYEEFYKQNQVSYYRKRDSYKFRMLLAPHKKANIDPIARFFDFVYPEPNTGCWIYTGEEMDKGYGRFEINKKRYPAHRYSWELHHNKKMPAELQACHKCNFPPCVNPDHIYAGTPSENMVQCVKQGRHSAFLLKKAVNQYTKDGTFVAKYESITEAAIALFGTDKERVHTVGKSISASCVGHKKYAYGFRWEHAK